MTSDERRCAVCSQPVVFVEQAAWCRACGAAYHRPCYDGLEGTCAACGGAPEGEESGVYSRVCPRCFRRNVPPAETCTECGAQTYWESMDLFQRVYVTMKQAAIVRLLKGAAELIGGMVAYAALWFLLLFGYVAEPRPILYVSAAVAVLVVFDGYRRMRRGRRMLLFE